MFELLDRMPRQPPAGDEKPIGALEGGEIVFNNVWCAPVTACRCMCYACIHGYLLQDPHSLPGARVWICSVVQPYSWDASKAV